MHTKKGVWKIILRKDAIARGLKIIQTRWIDVNKGDTSNPIYRSRFVAKEFNDGKELGLFAATPPLEALKMLIGEAATIEDEHEKVVMINDVSRAFFEAPARREVCIELPDEEFEIPQDGNDYVGYLEKSLYGTRDAAANFQQEIKMVMEKPDSHGANTMPAHIATKIDN